MSHRAPSIEQGRGPSKPPRYRPVAGLLLAASLWGLMWYPLRLLEAGGLGGLWQTFTIYCGTLIVALPLMRGRWSEPARYPVALLILALASGWCNTAFILAILDGTVVRVLLLFYLSPVWATLLAIVVLGERPRPLALLALLLALIGAVIMLWSPAVGLPWPLARSDWLALSSGMAFALANVATRYLGDVSVQVKTVTSWVGVIVVAGVLILATTTAPGLIPGAILGAGADAAPALVWLGALLLGAFGIVVMSFAVLYGVTHLPVHRSAVILLFEIVVGSASSLWLTDEVVQGRDWIGGGLILLAAVLSSREQAQG